MIEFVSYTGKYPNLCRGVLTIRVDDEEVKFGHDYSVFESWKTDGNYDSFWESGGSCGFYGDYTDSYIEGGDWEINISELPEKYQKYVDEIAEVFNDNVPRGCCGGCL